MKKHDTAKHRKRSKKEKANRKARLQRQVTAEAEARILSDQQLSPARQAFKDVDV